MTARGLVDEDWDEPDADSEEGDDYGDDDEQTFICPSCRGSVVEDTQKCPHCGDWIMPVEPKSGRGKWLIVAVVLMILLKLMITIL